MKQGALNTTPAVETNPDGTTHEPYVRLDFATPASGLADGGTPAVGTPASPLMVSDRTVVDVFDAILRELRLIRLGMLAAGMIAEIDPRDTDDTNRP
jgi:hypothetical protein